MICWMWFILGVHFFTRFSCFFFSLQTSFGSQRGIWTRAQLCLLLVFFLMIQWLKTRHRMHEPEMMFATGEYLFLNKSNASFQMKFKINVLRTPTRYAVLPFDVLICVSLCFCLCRSVSATLSHPFDLSLSPIFRLRSFACACYSIFPFQLHLQLHLICLRCVLHLKAKLFLNPEGNVLVFTIKMRCCHIFFHSLRLHWLWDVHESRKYANNSLFSTFQVSLDFVRVFPRRVLVNVFFPAVCICLEFGCCWCNCHCDLWRCQRINHLNLTSLHILQNESSSGCCCRFFVSFFRFLGFVDPKVVFANCCIPNDSWCCCFVSSHPSQTPDARQMNWHKATSTRWTEEDEAKNKPTTILMAAKCLISGRTARHAETKRERPLLGNKCEETRSNDMTTLWVDMKKNGARRGVVIFHLYGEIWFVVSMQLITLLSAMIHTHTQQSCIYYAYLLRWMQLNPNRNICTRIFHFNFT